MAAMLSLAGVAGCGDSNDNDADNQVVLTGDHCADACSRYATCFNTSFDVTACTNQCEASVSNNTITVQSTNDCLSCIGVNSCLATTFACSPFCDAIIIVQ